MTDHDDVGGALIARELHSQRRYRFALVPGIELTTRSGHLLALWVDEPLPSFRRWANRSPRSTASAGSPSSPTPSPG